MATELVHSCWQQLQMLARFQGIPDCHAPALRPCGWPVPAVQPACLERSQHTQLPIEVGLALSNLACTAPNRLYCRRYTEKTIGYAESHDQALVGDQTVGEQ